MAEPASDITRNHLIAAALPAGRDVLAAHLEHVSLDRRAVLEAPGAPIAHVYFPLSGLGSLVAIGSRRRDQRVEAGIFGREGMSGLPVVLGAARSPHEVYMQIPGEAMRLPVAAFGTLLDRPAIRDVLLRYVHAAHVQTTHTVLANATDRIETRLARWLLMAHDRTEGDGLPLTHEFLALMLGVRRAGVTVSVRALAREELIATSRGVITVIDRAGLLARADASYGAPEAEYQRLIGTPI
jgi:CRP-like cAMP-binding protein